MRLTTALRQFLAERGVEMVPGVYDALGARIAVKAGFRVLATTGNGMSAALLGAPDVGLLSLDEVVTQAGRVAAAAGVPVIADADNGYGGPLNVVRTVQSLERAGVAGLHLEDQAFPKRCAYLGQALPLVSSAEHVGRIQAAVAARRDPDLVIIARTDARELGIAEVVRRARLYASAGADMIFAARLDSPEEAAELARALPVPIAVNMNTAGALAHLQREELATLGVRVAFYPSVVRQTVVQALTTALRYLHEDGAMHRAARGMASAAAYNEVLDLTSWQELESRFTPAPGGSSPANG